MQKKKGRLHPIAYGSKILDKHQQNWSITCLEAFALVTGVHHFQFYIEGHKVILHTDHSALTYIAKQHLTDTKVARWLQTLINFDIQIIYEKASNNTVADVLSRNVDENNAIPFSTITENWLEEKFDQFCPPLTKTITTNMTKSSSTQTDQLPVYITQNKLHSKPAISKLSLSTDSISDRNDLLNGQRSDPYFAPIINFLERGELTGQDRLDRRIIIESEWFHLDNGILYRTSLTHYCKNMSRHKVVLCIPENLMLQAIIQTHNVGHLGITKLYLQLRQQYYSPKLRQMVKNVIQTCSRCQTAKPLHPSHQKPIKMARLPEPYSSYSMDLFGPVNDRTGNSGSPFLYVLVIKGLWSGYISLVPLSKTTTEAIADAIYSEIILRFGNFQTLCSDNAANMSTLVVKEICHLSIKTRKSYAYNPSSNGKIERTMAVIGAAFRKFGQDTKDWLHLLKVIASSINSSPQAHTQFSPFFLQHFHDYPSIFAFSDSTEADPTNDAHYYSNVVKRVMEDKRLSINIYQQIHDDYCKTQKDSKNKGRKVILLAINQLVY